MPLTVFAFLPFWPRPPGGIGRGRGLDPLQESRGLAPLQEHLPGVVCHGARGRPIQRCRHGPVRLRHLALRLRAHGREGDTQEENRGSEREREGEGDRGKNHSGGVRGRDTGEGNEEQKVKGEEGARRGRELQRLTDGLGCTVDVRRVGSLASWLQRSSGPGFFNLFSYVHLKV